MGFSSDVSVLKVVLLLFAVRGMLRVSCKFHEITLTGRPVSALSREQSRELVAPHRHKRRDCVAPSNFVVAPVRAPPTDRPQCTDCRPTSWMSSVWRRNLKRFAWNNYETIPSSNNPIYQPWNCWNCCGGAGNFRAEIQFDDDLSHYIVPPPLCQFVIHLADPSIINIIGYR